MLQDETVIIMGILSHVSLKEVHMVIHIGSTAATNSLKHRRPSNKIIINWVPQSHRHQRRAS